MLIYFLKVNFLLLIFTVAYWLLLRRGKLLQLNRAILLASILLAFLLPVLPLDNFLESELSTPVREITGRATNALSVLAPASLEVKVSGKEPGTGSMGQVMPAGRAFSWVKWSVIAVAAFLFFLLIRQFVHIFRLVLYSTNTREDGLTIVHTAEDVPPFSFFRFLVINPANYAGEELRQIIVHEKVHIRQYHYLDILAGEMLRVLCWYNPTAWWLNRLLKINLEYIADREVLAAGVDRKRYQYQLLHMSARGQSLRLTTPLNYSPIKMRISMMNANKSSLLGRFRYALLLPVLCLSVWAINPTQAQQTLEMVAASPTFSSASSATTSAVSGGTAAITSGSEDIFFVITPTVSRKVLLDVKDALVKKGITVQYDNLNFNNGRLTAISVSIRSADYSGNLSYDPLDGRLVFYDLRMTDKITGFEYGTPSRFSPKQIAFLDTFEGLFIKKPGGKMSMIGTAEIPD